MGVKDVSLEFDDIPADGFKPGTTVSGRVKFTTDKPVRMKNVTLLFQGKAKVSFHSHEIRWFKHGRRDDSVLGFGSVFDVNWNAISFRRRLSDRTWFRSEQLFAGTSHQLAEESCLHMGVTEYPFQFQLPHDIPPTFEKKNIRAHGEIRYKIKVKWSQSGFLAPSDTYKVELPVVNPESSMYLRSKDPKLLEPRVYQDVRPFPTLFSSSDPVKVVIKVPRSAVISGETLQVDINIDNSSKIKVDTISVRFIQRTAWLGKHMIHKNVMLDDVVLHEVHYAGLPPQSNKSWTQPIPINANPTANLEPCSIIKLCHIIMVEVVPSGMYSRLSSVVPVEVCFGTKEELTKQIVSVSPPADSSDHQYDSSEPPPYPGPPPYSAVASGSTNN